MLAALPGGKKSDSRAVNSKRSGKNAKRTYRAIIQGTNDESGRQFRGIRGCYGENRRCSPAAPFRATLSAADIVIAPESIVAEVCNAFRKYVRARVLVRMGRR
jgi:hypothetical protein